MYTLRNSMTRWVLWILALQLSAAIGLYADVIYLNDGNILLVSKAWEEGDQVKYQTSKGIQSLPKSSVQSIRHEEPPPAPSGGRKWVQIGPDGQGAQTGASAPTPPLSVPASSGPALSKEALGRLRDNLRADPSDAMAKAELVHALNSVASLQVSQGDLASAQSSLEEALNLDKRNPVLLSNLATVHFRSGNYQKSQDLLLACLEVDRNNQWAYYLLGESYYKQEKISQAISTWNEGLQLGPNDVITGRLEKARRESGVHNELQALQSTHFVLRYDRKGTDSQLGEQILAALEDLYRRLSNELTPRAPETIAVIVYPDQAYFDITRAPGWSGGVFDGKIRIPVRGLFSVTPQLKAILAHELAHSFMAALPGRGSPTWFLEGVAQVEEGRSATGDRKGLVQLQQAGRLIPLEKLRDSFMGLPAGAADLAYTESLSAVEYLVGRFGRSGLRNLLDLMARNYNFENAFNTALQRSVPEFETAWRNELSR